MKISLHVNGATEDVDAEPSELLVERLRDGMGLTGTKVGCDTGQCGTCVVHLDGTSVKSCLLLTVQAAGSEVTTIEGASPDAGLTDLQEALRAEHGTQCGFCTPGMVMSLSDQLTRSAGAPTAPTEPEIREWLTGNLCRCTGYQSVVRGVQRVCAAAAQAQAEEV